MLPSTISPARLPIGEVVVTAVTLLDATPGDDAGRNLADLYDAVGDAATRSGGRFAGGNGATAIALHPPDEAAGAINATISLLEQHPQGLAVGVAFGEITWAGQPRSIVPTGPVATACRLADLANTGTILLDLDLVAVTPLHRIASDAGQRCGRRLADYLSEPHALPSQDRQRIGFVELLWDSHSHGIRPRAMSDLAWWRAPDPQPAPESGPPDPPRGSPWHRGRLRSWNRDRQRGIIATDDDRRFYVDDRFLAVTSPPAIGDHVWFVPRPALIAGRNPVAAAVISVGPPLLLADDQPDPLSVTVTDPAGVTASVPLTPGGEPSGAAATIVLDRRSFVAVPSPVPGADAIGSDLQTTRC